MSSLIQLGDWISVKQLMSLSSNPCTESTAGEAAGATADELKSINSQVETVVLPLTVAHC